MGGDVKDTTVGRGSGGGGRADEEESEEPPEEKESSKNFSTPRRPKV